MACKLKRDSDNNVVGIETPGGESSLLFDRLLNATGDPAVLSMYTEICIQKSSKMTTAWTLKTIQKQRILQHL